MSRFLRHIFVFCALAMTASCSSSKETVDTSALLASAPQTPREFRAAWIATVDNIDWPSKKGLTVEAQKAELLAMLDRAFQLNLNAVIFQVRPTADALYKSDLEPWSEYLTGTQGLAPAMGFDPLEFAVEQAHKRGLELHAWFNPFRAFHPSATGPLAETHISKRHPELVNPYGDLLWIDPGEPAAAEHSNKVILDVVKRYDIDGVHLDDYFYPYPINGDDGEKVGFPDDRSWKKVQREYPNLTRDNWRRANIDTFVQKLYGDIKDEKPWVKFGISPFGIWRPGHPPGVTGFDAYEGLYADARIWLNNGWIDYFTPQLYWAIDSPGQPYKPLLNWWIGENLKNRHIWPGNFTSRTFLEGDRHWEPEEIVNQVKETRASRLATGNVHFSMKALMADSERAGEALYTYVYQQPAAIPASPWLDNMKPDAPKVTEEKQTGRAVIRIEPEGDVEVFRWVIRGRYGSEWTTVMIPGSYRRIMLNPQSGYERPGAVIVTGLSRTGIESPPVVKMISTP